MCAFFNFYVCVKNRGEEKRNTHKMQSATLYLHYGTPDAGAYKPTSKVYERQLDDGNGGALSDGKSGKSRVIKLASAVAGEVSDSAVDVKDVLNMVRPADLCIGDAELILDSVAGHLKQHPDLRPLRVSIESSRTTPMRMRQVNMTMRKLGYGSVPMRTVDRVYDFFRRVRPLFILVSNENDALGSVALTIYHVLRELCISVRVFSAKSRECREFEQFQNAVNCVKDALVLVTPTGASLCDGLFDTYDSVRERLVILLPHAQQAALPQVLVRNATFLVPTKKKIFDEAGPLELDGPLSWLKNPRVLRAPTGLTVLPDESVSVDDGGETIIGFFPCPRTQPFCDFVKEQLALINVKTIDNIMMPEAIKANTVIVCPVLPDDVGDTDLLFLGAMGFPIIVSDEYGGQLREVNGVLCGSGADGVISGVKHLLDPKERKLQGGKIKASIVADWVSEDLVRKYWFEAIVQMQQ